MLGRFRLPINRVGGLKLISSLKLEKPVFLLSSPGARIIQLSRPYEGNILTEDIIQTMTHNIKLIEENDTVAVMFVVSQSPDRFSDGLARTQSGISQELIKSSNTLAQKFSNMSKESIVVYSGEFDNTAFSMFAGCRYRLGTESTSMSVRVFENGRLNVGGGLAYFFAQGSRTGYAILRFLSVVERKINAFDMHGLGLLTHVVETEPHSTIADAVAHTIGARDNVKAEQTLGVDTSNLADILDTMNVLDDNEEISPKLNTIMDDPLWGKIMLVPPSCNEPVEEGNLSPDFENFLKEIEHCFIADDVEECKKRLSTMADSMPWAKEALNRMDQLPDKDLKEWFRITKLASKLSLSKTLEEEEMVHRSIQERML